MSLSAVGAPAIPRPLAAPVLRAGTRQMLPVLLLVLFLLYTFVGVSPMSDGDAASRVDGNAVDRLAVFGLAGVALLVLAARWRSALRLAARGWLVFLTLGWFAASVAWSAFPDLSLRRVASVILGTIVCLAIATGVRDARTFHRTAVAVLTLVVLANLAVIALDPGFAATDIGWRGIYTQKNQAGLVAMVAAILAFAWTLPQRRALPLAAGGGATAVALLFLWLSDSKTSMGLTALAVLALPGFALLHRLGAGRSLLLAVLMLPVLGVAALFFDALGGNWVALVSGGGDASFTGRAEIWQFALDEIGRRPWFGIGYGAFWDVGLENDPLLRAPPGEWLSQVKIGVINQAHDGFLDVLLQGGIPALALALLQWGQACLALLRRAFASAAGEGGRHVAATLLVLMVVILIHNVTETSLWARGQMLASLSILVSFLALAAGMRRDGPAGARNP